MRNLAFLLPGIFFFTSCKKADLGDCFKSAGEPAVEIRELPSFNRIETYDNVDVYITLDTFNQARVEAGEHLIEKIKTEVKDGVVKIENLNSCNWVRSFKNEYSVYLTVDTFKELDCYGVGDIIGESPITTDSVKIEMLNSYSDVFLEVHANYVHAKIHAGPGDVHLVGSTDFCYTYSTGAGFIYASELVAREAWAITSGTGEIYVNAQDKLFCQIDYISNVYYKGNPTSIEQQGNGSGKLVHLGF